MTQQQLADVMREAGSKIHRSTIGKIESGDRACPSVRLSSSPGILGIDLSELSTCPGTGQPRAPQRKSPRASSTGQGAARPLEEAQLL